ncbi:MAG: cyclic nucleotide-binding domain-containing protein [Deltaproteobacteria bacterium]|nr:cyclic nucleotide-binding domain-containing protein [Deltaproteobacteria bacterium]
MKESDILPITGHLAQTNLLKNVSEEKIAEFASICRKVIFKKGDVIVREGDIGDTMYMIVEGTVEVARTLVFEDLDEKNPLGNKVFAKLSAKDHAVFGEISLLESSPRTATITALTDSFFYEIKRADFLRLARKDSELGFQIIYNVATVLGARLRKADEDITKLTTVLTIVLKESV